MPEIQQDNIYESESADRVVSDLFSGRMSIEQALERLRTKLLDLTSRNRLVNFKFPKGRSIQFVDKPNLNLVFSRLIDGKSLPIKFVPDPPTSSYVQKKPDVKAFAQEYNIDTETDFPLDSCGPYAHRHTPKLQALYYPPDLDKLCRKIASEARTVIEETGTNMLYLIFGFVEFYERDDSEKSMFAPLLAVPVTLDKGAIDPDTRTYQYSINYSGEDIHENQTFREKLKQDNLNLPDYTDEEDPGKYFASIAHSIRNKKRWQVKYQLTLGFLSFGKLAIWDDLDANKWPMLLKHPLLNEIFSGGTGRGTSLTPEDYKIDNHPQGDISLIYDADSSQHSAIIDVLSGKNMVINGPPGTGKSQTITNVIAAGLKAGKKILFVSEKLAALEVVRHRLNHANLGHFCLELHSHKTQKKKLLSDLQDRLDSQFRVQKQLQSKITTLNRHKKELNRYAELISSRIGNELGLTVYEIFWKTEKCRQAIGNLVNNIQSLNIQKCDKFTFNDIESLRAKLEVLGQQFSIIENYDSKHPWWGFTPKQLAPGDDLAIGLIINEVHALADAFYIKVIEFQELASFEKEPTIDTLTSLHRVLQELPAPPVNIRSELFPRVFNSNDPLGKHNRGVLNGVIRKVVLAKELLAKSEEHVSHNCQVSYETAMATVEKCSKHIYQLTLSIPLDELEKYVLTTEIALNRFRQANSEFSFEYHPIFTSSVENLDSKLQATLPLSLSDQPGRSIRDGVGLLFQEVSRLEQSLDRVALIAKRRDLKFDGTPDSIENLGRGDGIDEVMPGVVVDSAVLEKAKLAAEFYLSDLAIGELDRRQHDLYVVYEKIARLLHEIAGYANKLGLPFDGTLKSIDFLATICKISASAPSDLLDYRHASLAHPVALELLPRAEEAYSSEVSQRQSLANEFYLDVLPELGNLKSAIMTFRRGDNIFNIFNSEWRAAKKLFNSLSKSKVKCKASVCEEKITSLVCWIEHCTSFVANDDFKRAFGPLFKGFDTDFTKIRRLHSWYIASQAELLKHPGFIEQVDLSTLSPQTINQLGALSTWMQAAATEFDSCLEKCRQLLGEVAPQQEVILRQSGWNEYIQKIHLIAEGFKDTSSYLKHYVKSEVSPKRSVDVLNAKLELLSAASDFKALNYGIQAIRYKLEPLLPGISQIPCLTWKKYLSQLAKLAHAADSMVETLYEFADSNCNAAKAHEFMVAKLGLHDLLSKFTACPDRTTTNWDEFISISAQRIGEASELVNLLKPAAILGKTSDEVISGLKSREQSAGLIHEIRNDGTIMAMLQELFEGMDTDLDSLSATLSWGEEVSRKRTLQVSPLLSFLLSENAVDNYVQARERLQNIIELHRNAQNKLNKLKDFGDFEPKNWFSEGDGYAHLYLKRVEFAAAKLDSVLSWSKYSSQRRTCRDIGLQNFVTLLEEEGLPVDKIGDVFEFVVYRSIGRKIYKQFPEFENFSSVNHEKLRLDFISLDRDIIHHTGKSFAYDIDKAKSVPEGETGYRASDRTEMHLLHNELGKSRRHIPIRQLIRRAGRAIQALKPCFMMGPLSVAQYLQQGAVYFDLIVMDEASQLRPEESLGAIARGSQLIVVGDPKQLPPTNFFDRLVDDGEEDDDSDAPAILSGSESILDICQQLFHPVRTLRWHYRSQHESLIAFSNHHFYNGKLIVFPSPFARNNRLGLRYRYIKNGVYKDRQNMPEAQRIADAVIEHMMKYPDESLGVVTLNQTQKELVEDLLDKKLRNIEEAQAFISKWEEEGWPFFVKNLENVQGDERDIIFISTTFGKASGTDKVRQNFGPISRPDGWRRLNVLFTRARRKIELFTSMLPEDILIEAKTPAGTKAMRDYLDFAKRGILTSVEVTGREPDSDFEISVGDMLRNRDYEVVPQVGVAGFFIDLAVRNPDRPGEFLAAIECDGASYHSSNSARDRDRIRQDILESLGWKGRIWRIWSTDWFYNPRRESERLLKFLEERRAIARAEPLDYETEEVFEESDEPVVQPLVEPVETTDPSLSVSTEELYVEVGDFVTYYAVDKPEERHSVMIVDSESNARRNLINENAPLAKALLDATIGDEVEMVIHGSQSKMMRVLKIQRQERMFQ